MAVTAQSGQTVPFDRSRVLDAVLDELVRWGIDRFSVAALTGRHGWDLAAVSTVWPDPDKLILEALTSRHGDDPVAPDTGSLRTDVFALAMGMAQLVSAEGGHKLHRAHLIDDPGISNTDLRRAAWRARADRMRVIFERAHERGELRDDVDHDTALQLIFAPINMRILYTGEPVDEEYCLTLADLVCRAVTVS